MSYPPSQRESSNDQGGMDFIETAQYTTTSPSAPENSRPPPPHPWQQHRHPNGDIYFFNPELRLITPDDACDPVTLEYVVDAREDHLQCLEDDPNVSRLPPDYELVISDVSETTAVIRMYSRSAGAAYAWTEATGTRNLFLDLRAPAINEKKGLTMKTKEHFWSHVAEYPSHHRDLPPNTEGEFVAALQNAKAAIAHGTIFPFSERQIDQIIARYQQLNGFRSGGRNVTPSLAWLIGAVMPLDAVGRRFDDQNLNALMNGLQF